MNRAYASGLVVALMSVGSVAFAQPKESVPAVAPVAAPSPAETKPPEPAPKSAETKPDAAPAVPKPPEPTPPRPRATLRTVGYVVECVGLAGIIAGAVLKSMSSAKHGVIDDHCDANRVCDQAGLDAVSSASKLQTAAFASLGGGLVALGAGIALVVSNPEGGGASASLRPTALRGGGGLSVGGRF
jgi:hypothetical protein